MSKRTKHTTEEKYEILNEYYSGTRSIQEIATKHNISIYTLYKWRYNYDKYGVDGLRESKTWKKYSKELKEQVVLEYLSGKYSQGELVKRYEITDKTVLKRWINNYNSHREVTAKPKGMRKSMAKGRSTSLEERIEIAKYCIDHNNNYQQVAETYQVSYQQVYQWAKKYKSGGENALQDTRGKKKNEEEFTPEEKMKLEMKKLEVENERLRAENAFLKKLGGTRKEAVLSRIRQENKYIAISQLHTKEKFSISLLCEIAMVSRSSYYKWMKREESALEIENKILITEIIKLYETVGGIYGYRRMTMNLNRKLGQVFNHKRIYRLMRISALKSIIRRKKRRYIKSNSQHIAENLLNREFTADKSNQKWLTDVTELKYGKSQKAYLSAILDLHDKSIVAYVLGHYNNNDLVFKTLDMALESLPGVSPLIHSDRGFQYTSYGFKRKLAAAGMTQSMSRVGKCIDNGPMEAFWGIIKCEQYYLHKYHSYDELSNAIDEYINFYNTKRLQKNLNGLSPMEFRALVA
ncbi:IS3 family transposase [Clostridium botulinum]|uniref:IS3 family transposase n=1 Tax=Clostridium botulinum TaxID=1491 RepID=UPI003DA537B1